MAVIWGLDLKEMQWRKFSNSYMWADTYHLRRTKFIVYQLAMILCVVSESLGTDVLSKYLDQRKAVERDGERAGIPATIRSHDVVGSFAYNIFVGVFVATIFGSAFFFDLFWPERHEIRGVKIAWRFCSILACCFALSSAIVLSVVLSTRRAEIVGPVATHPLKPPLEYKRNHEAVASLALIWLGWLATLWSAYLMWTSISHIDKFGPLSTHARKAADIENGTSAAQSSTVLVPETEGHELKAISSTSV